MAPLQQPESPHAQRQLSAVAHGPRGTSHSLAGGPVRRLASHTEPRFANDVELERIRSAGADRLAEVHDLLTDQLERLRMEPPPQAPPPPEPERG